MANAVTTPTSSASETTGAPIPLAYGYVWVTGKRAEYYQLQDTGNSTMNYTRLGIWLLGHGEWDGCTELWINDKLVWEGDVAASAPSGFSGQTWKAALDGGPAMVFNFHRGSDATIGAGLTPSSSGPDQGVDVLFAQFPPAINPLAYSRIAYYTIMRKQPIQNQTSTKQSDPTQWSDIAPIGLWRGIRCRTFDDEGNQTGYSFTTNPAWHFVDVLLRRKIMPDYALDLTAGPDVLSTAVKNRFEWGTIYSAAQYFDEILSNGRRRFMGSYCFSQQTTLQAVLEQILLCCRSFSSEYAGKIALNCDMPRSSVFTFSREHILPGSWEASDQTLHTAANRFIANFRDVLVPQCSEIKSIVFKSNTRPIMTTKEPHPFDAGDRIAIGGTETTYDGEWSVYSVPDVINPGTVDEVDPSTLVLVSKGSNYPSSVGAVGGCGLLYSRFKERSPEFWHKNNMLARGSVGLSIARKRNKVKQVLDFATTTYDQSSRLACYERDRLLGADASPYVTPPSIKFRTSMFARDASGNLACAIRPGDRVTLDSTTNFQYAGECEVLDPLSIYPPSVQVSSSGSDITRKAEENSGEIEFSLGPYNAAIMYDTSDSTQAGWPSVEGSDPGNDTNYTSIDLANGGNFVFFTGRLASGSQFQLPSTGYTATNMLAWAGPAGANIKYHSMRIIQLCSVSSDRMLTLIYSDGPDGHVWNGDVNYAALSWLSSDTTTTSNGITWLELTLLGGEIIVFGQGVLAHGATITLPDGFSTDKMFAVAFPHDSPSSSYNAQSVGAYVDSSRVVHFDYDDSKSHDWHGNAAVLVFAWQNNMSTVTTETLSGVTWMQCTLTNGKIFGIGCAKNMANGATFTLPSAAGDGSTLEAMVGSCNGRIIGGHHAQGVGSCYLDADDIVHITFQDGSSNVWAGEADVFALYCTSSATAITSVAVTPASASIAGGATQQFAATITGIANSNVTWSVDGVSGGNVTVGTIDSSGLYSAPTSTGSHTITATSVADTTASGSAAVAITGSGSGSGGFTVDED